MKWSRIAAAVGAAWLCAWLCFLLCPISALAVNRPAQPGSFLIYPKFDIRTGACTQLRITNTNSTGYIAVKLNYVCPGVLLGDQRCLANNRTVVLTPDETRVIDVAEHRPQCKRGFVVAFALAVNPRTLVTGAPISFNYLTGSWHITHARRLDSENAIAVQSPQPEGATLGVGTPLQLRFGDGKDYEGLAGALHTDFRAPDAAADAGSTLTLVSLDTLAGRQNPSTAVYLDFWNQVEVPYSSSHEYVCWDESALDDIDTNFTVDALGSSYGSLTLGAMPNCPLPGGCPPLVPFMPVIAGVLSERNSTGASVRNLLQDGAAGTAAFVPR